MALRSDLLAASVLLTVAACSYDLDRLRGANDGSIDTVGDAAFDDVASDDASVPVDVGVEMGVDLGTPDVLDPTQCTVRSAPNATDVGTLFGGSLVISGDTVGQPSLLDPPTTTGCEQDYSSNPSPEQVYRYVVTTGPSLQATTDAPDCAGAFDTVVYIRTTCDRATGTTLVCNDDDSVLSGCAPANGASGGLTSTATATGLVPGQVVFVVVDGFGGHAGRFRLTLTENGLPMVAPPDGTAGISAANRCVCPSSLDTSVLSTPFPSGADVVSAMSPPTLARASDALGGTHDVMGLTQVGGVGVAFQLLSNHLSSGGTVCASLSGVTVDVMVHNVAVQSFLLDARAPVGTPLRVPFQQFGDVALAGSTSVALRVRDGSATCGGFVVDTGAPANALTLLGAH